MCKGGNYDPRLRGSLPHTLLLPLGFLPTSSRDSSPVAQWAEQIRLGDAQAFEALFRSLHAPLVRFADGLAGEAAEADDLVQEAFVRLWERRTTLDADRSVRALLYRTVRNLAYNRTRDRSRRRHLLEARVLPDAAPRADLVLEARHTAEHLRRAVAALPERQREAFLLTRVEGLSHADVADVMGIAAATVNVHLVRALKALRASLGADAPIS